MRLNRLIVGWCLAWTLTPMVFAQGGPSLVDVVPVERGAVEVSRPLVASLEPMVYSRLAAEEGGLVTERFFEEGQHIKAGDVLVRLDSELLTLRANALKAKLQSQKAELERSHLERASAERELQRQKSLYDQNVSPEKEFLDAKTTFDRSTALVSVEEANVAEAEAEVAELEALIRKYEITSPIDGTVAGRHVEVGQWIDQGESIADVVSLEQLYAVVDVPEAMLRQVSPGTKVRLTLAAYPDQPFDVEIAFTMPQADMSTRSFKAKAIVDNPDGHLRPGFLARATIVSRRDDLLRVPKDALVFDGEAAHVVVARDNAAAIVPVKVIAGVGSIVGVEGDLAEGEMVVTRGNEALMPGMPLQLPGPPGGAPNGDAPPQE